MPVPTSTLLGVIRATRSRLGADVSLLSLARLAKRSPFELHRSFRMVTGETTKRFTQRLRLERAASQLLSADRRVIEIALDAGFASHEAFTRAFSRQFGLAPRRYRQRGLRGGVAFAARHAAIVAAAGPCIALHHVTLPRRTPMPVAIEKKQHPGQHALVIRRRTSMTDIAKTLGEILPKVFGFAQKQGLPFAGPPFTRYVELTRGSAVMQAGMPIAIAATGEGEIEPLELPAGPVVSGLHVGPYDKLVETYAALETWMADHGLTPSGPPWEVYLTDPGEHPDPKDWRTEVFFPL